VLSHYDGLQKWKFTNIVVIDDSAISHSHPVLTIGTGTQGAKTETGLLATYLHEQIHWFLSRHPVRLRRAIGALKISYPRVIVGRKEGGARDEKSTYLHLLVCTLEYDALRAIIGEIPAMKIISSKQYYRWIYVTVLRDFERLMQICDSNSLLI